MTHARRPLHARPAIERCVIDFVAFRQRGGSSRWSSFRRRWFKAAGKGVKA